MTDLFRMHNHLSRLRALLAEALLAEAVRHRRIIRLAADIASLTKEPVETVLSIGRIDAANLQDRIRAEAHRETERISR